MYHYEYKNNMYYLIDEHGEAITAHDKVALGFSYNKENGGILHKHGSLENVSKWAIKTRKQFMSASRDFELHKSITARGVPTTSIDYEQMAKNIVVIEGILPVKEVQKCIDISGYIGRYYEKLQKDKHET